MECVVLPCEVVVELWTASPTTFSPEARIVGLPAVTMPNTGQWGALTWNFGGQVGGTGSRQGARARAALQAPKLPDHA